ncbi:hypothetical protein SRHO_G00171230 [Serrasalmus rhombeus]
MEEEEDFPWAEWLLRPDAWALLGVPKGTPMLTVPPSAPESTPEPPTATAPPDVLESTSEPPAPPDVLDGTPVPTAPPGVPEDNPGWPAMPVLPGVLEGPPAWWGATSTAWCPGGHLSTKCTIRCSGEHPRAACVNAHRQVSWRTLQSRLHRQHSLAPTAPPDALSGTMAPIALSAPPWILEDCPDFPLAPLWPCLSFITSPAWAQPPDLTLPLTLVAVGRTEAVERWSHHHHCPHSAAEQRKEPPYDAKASRARGVLASSCSNFIMLI